MSGECRLPFHWWRRFASRHATMLSGAIWTTPRSGSRRVASQHLIFADRLAGLTSESLLRIRALIILTVFCSAALLPILPLPPPPLRPQCLHLRPWNVPPEYFP